MPRIHILMAACMICSVGSYAQQNNNWYFGRKAAVTFNAVPGQPTPSNLENSAMNADEGSSTISDATGRLLFYCNGITVYNRLHKVMLNGDNLKGNISACQSNVIVPCPGNDSIFYIFTSDALENNYNNGYCYSIVNINRDNGNGEIISKNNLLFSSGTERLVAARHANGIDIWIITNDNQSNKYRAWLVTCAGLQSTEVVSSVGAVLSTSSTAGVGMMKVSSDGKYLCQTQLPEFDGIVIKPHFCQLFDFDNATGQLSNPRKLEFPDAQIYACEFSPNSKLLYLTSPLQHKLDQVECSLPGLSAILASRVTIVPNSINYYATQLAPDGKIYLCAPSTDHLDVINSPNVKGVGCNFSEQAFTFKGYFAFLGLPAFVNDIAKDDPLNNFTYTITDTCAGQVQFNTETGLPGIVKWEWDFGDGQNSTVQNPSHIFATPTRTYIVTLVMSSDIFCGKIRRTKYLTINPVAQQLDFEYFKRCDSGYVRFVNAMQNIPPGAFFTWDFGDNSSSNEINPIHHYNSTGVYHVKLQYQRSVNCQPEEFLKVVDYRPFPITVSASQTIFYGQSVQLQASSPHNNYHWTPTTGLNNPFIANPVATPLTDMIYKVSSSDLACESVDSIRITVVDADDIFVPTAFSPNHDGRNDRLIPIIGSKYTLEEFSVFNRWGIKVFSTKNRGEGWDGNVRLIEQQSAVFIYYIRAAEPGKKPVEKKGTVTLLK